MTSHEPTRLLKANSIRELGSKVVFNYEDIQRRCDDYVEQVRNQTRQMLVEADAEAEAIRRRAHEEGRQAGHREGSKQAKEEIQNRARELAEEMATESLKTTLPAMQAAAEALSQERDRWLAEWEAGAIRLSVAIAEKLLRRELSLKPEINTELLIDVLELATGNPQIELLMHPDDVKLLGEQPEQVIRSMASCGEARLVPDESITRGGCVIKTQQGQIDARLETQVERITDELLA